MSATFKPVSRHFVHIGGLTNSHTYSTKTTLPPTCNLHLGRETFHLNVTATGQAGRLEHPHAHSCTLSPSLSLSPPAALFRYVDVSAAMAHTLTQVLTLLVD